MLEPLCAQMGTVKNICTSWMIMRVALINTGTVRREKAIACFPIARAFSVFAFPHAIAASDQNTVLSLGRSGEE